MTAQLRMSECIQYLMGLDKPHNSHRLKLVTWSAWGFGRPGQFVDFKLAGDNSFCPDKPNSGSGNAQRLPISDLDVSILLNVPFNIQMNIRHRCLIRYIFLDRMSREFQSLVVGRSSTLFRLWSKAMSVAANCHATKP
jgi:hypothetical protein